MDPAHFITAARVFEKRPDAPAMVLGRALKLYEVELSSVDLAVEEKLPPADRAVLQLAQALGAVTAADVRAYLGLGPELSPHIVARLTKIGLLRASSIAPRVTSARQVEHVQIDCEPGLSLTEAGAEALAAGARVIIRQRSLRLLMSADPLVVVSVLSRPMHARARGDLPLPPTEVPKPLQALDAVLRASRQARFEALGLDDTLTDIPGGERIEGRLLGCSLGAPYEVRLASENLEAWLLIAVHTAPMDPLTPRLHTAISRRGETELRPLVHIHPFAALPSWLHGLRDVDKILHDAGMRLLAPAALPPFPVLADGTQLLELLGPGDEPAPVWRALPDPGDGFLARVHLRGIPTSTEAAHDALFTFLSRRPNALRTGLARALAITWEKLCSFWSWSDAAPPDITTVHERLWAQPALRGVLCAGRLERDLVAPYLAEVRHD
ncbi:uncharacterized protein SOCE26_036800 [Sorangium cellulosum]|uniref:Uncharacterized protein n=1 Tax=Sorangium cellulosum TaxID=56 RepID=A0A2L0ESH4_SORCE|nr:hypothetical protein [Sorangium cellulosum]AUX42251.1 uncharacterized protein SOCE26_036800 [Sorangium cellulosum]